MKKIIFFVFILINGLLINAQEGFQQSSLDNTRIATIENQLKILEVEIPGLIEKVDVNISNTTLPNFLRAISQVHKININITNDLNSINIVNGFNDVTVHDLFLFLIKEYQLDIDVTGNILSFKKYKKPEVKPIEKEVNVNYDVSLNTLSTDLNNNALSKVFRKIMDVSGKNLLYSPELGSKNLTLYLNNVAFDIALEKLANTNGLELNKTRDGFYEFESIEGYTGTQEGSAPSRRPRRPRANFYYKVVDTLNKVIAVDLQNTPIADVVYNITEDLKIDIFTASPLENAGTVTVKAEAISFDDLLVQIFESNSTSSNTVTNTTGTNQNQRNTQNSQNPQRTPSTGSNGFTFRKEGNVYYFGTENQLLLKRIERVQMMHRSIAVLGDANSSGGSGNFGRSNFVSGSTNFFGGGQNNGLSQQGSFNNRNNPIGNTQNTNFSSRSSNNSSTVDPGAIMNIFPAAITEGLDIKIDTELNSFIVSGASTRVEKFKEFVTYIDKPVPLILIEVMILEVNRTATVETGVEFGLGKEPTTTEGVTFPNANITLGAQTINRIIGGFDGFGSLNLGNVKPNFYLDIKAMESNGNVKILSTPKLSTINGHKAYLSSGQTTYYAVVNQNFFGSQIPQTSEITNYQPIDAELALEFKPFVSGDGQITLDIQVIQSNFSGTRIAEDAPPDINSRRFSSIMRMQANDIAILGGIEQKVKNDSGSGVPLLARIPIIKWLFSKRKREDSKKKLNVIIKPTVFY